MRFLFTSRLQRSFGMVRSRCDTAAHSANPTKAPTTRTQPGTPARPHFRTSGAMLRTVAAGN